MKTESQINRIISDVMSAACPAVRFGSEATLLEHDRKRERAMRYCERFTRKMKFGVPYQSESEAITALAPVAIWFLGWAARQFAIYVIRLLWARWHAK